MGVLSFSSSLQTSCLTVDLILMKYDMQEQLEAPSIKRDVQTDGQVKIHKFAAYILNSVPNDPGILWSLSDAN